MLGGGGLADPPVGGDGAVGVDGEPPQATAVVSTAQTTSVRGMVGARRAQLIVAPNGALELDKSLQGRHGYNMGPCAPA